jgi:hypothetical protein
MLEEFARSISSMAVFSVPEIVGIWVPRSAWVREPQRGTMSQRQAYDHFEHYFLRLQGAGKTDRLWYGMDPAIWVAIPDCPRFMAECRTAAIWLASSPTERCMWIWIPRSLWTQDTVRHRLSYGESKALFHWYWDLLAANDQTWRLWGHLWDEPHIFVPIRELAFMHWLY